MGITLRFLRFMESSRCEVAELSFCEIQTAVYIKSSNAILTALDYVQRMICGVYSKESVIISTDSQLSSLFKECTYSVS